MVSHNLLRRQLVYFFHVSLLGLGETSQLYRENVILKIRDVLLYLYLKKMPLYLSLNDNTFWGMNVLSKLLPSYTITPEFFDLGDFRLTVNADWCMVSYGFTEGLTPI